MSSVQPPSSPPVPLMLPPPPPKQDNSEEGRGMWRSLFNVLATGGQAIRDALNMSTRQTGRMLRRA